MNRISTRSPKSALVVAHPGHELRVYGWLQQARPIVFVLTDGSGGGARSRLESTRRIVRDAGATEGTIFGRMPDRELYAAVMRGDTKVFTALADELAAALVASDRHLVVCDAREGYNSAHDLCWFVVEAAAAIARHAMKRDLMTLDFPLVAAPDSPAMAGEAMRLVLDDQAFDRKLAAAAGYPEMAGEVQAALSRFSASTFQVECFSPAAHDLGSPWQPAGIPFYEEFGQRQVAAGVYGEVLRAREHMAPLVASLRQHARERTACQA